jgi:hypothetical protein
MLRNDPAGSAAKHRAALRQALVGGVPGVEFGRYFLRCLRVCSAYRLDCSYALANFVTNKYRGHRGIPADAVMDKIVAECAAKLQVNPEVLLSPRRSPLPPRIPSRRKYPVFQLPRHLRVLPSVSEMEVTRWWTTKSNRLWTTCRILKTARPCATGTWRAACSGKTQMPP